MGHEHCGAVTAAYEAYETKTEVEGPIGELIEAITPDKLKIVGAYYDLDGTVEFL